MAVDLTSHALTTLDALKDELGISVSTFDDTLKRYINAVSRRISEYCGRTFYFEEAIEEYQPGHGGTALLVDRPPIVTIDSITYDGSTVESSSYTSRDQDKKAGLIYREYGWIWTAKIAAAGVVDDRLPGTEEREYLVTYDGGYVTPKQVDDDGSLTRTLPEDLEDACILACTMRYLQKGQNLNVKSEKSLSYSVAYGGSGNKAGDGQSSLPAEVRAMLAPYVRHW